MREKRKKTEKGKKRKEREDYWIDVELEVRRICGYKQRNSKKVFKRIREKEIGESRDIRDMLGREEAGPSQVASYFAQGAGELRATACASGAALQGASA